MNNSGTGPFAVVGTLMHAPRRGAIEVLKDALIRVDGDGVIEGICDPGMTDYARRLDDAARSGTLVRLGSGRYLLPGMIDLHVHAPQWPQLGKALDLPLERWLQERTFPLEAKYSDLDYARAMYGSLVRSLLANGTTTAVYFATIHPPATRLLAEICLASGQRALVGKVVMDNPDECPDFYRDANTAQALDDTRAFIDHVQQLPGNESRRVAPVITPRFIPSCTDRALEGLGIIARDTGCHVQTHCSESDWEHGYVLDRHGMTDTRSLDRFGLLTRRTVLAHGNFVDDGDMSAIQTRASGIAHCPLSNYYFSNAVFPARRALDAGLHLGLGTDISGGPSPSLFHNCAMAVTSSRALEEGVDARTAPGRRGRDGSRIDFREAFWMATAGGAEVLELNAGRFASGCVFDAVVVDTGSEDSNLRVRDDLDTHEDALQKIIYNIDRRNIELVWVQGQLVAGAGATDQFTRC